jgi:TonB family protein
MIAIQQQEPAINKKALAWTVGVHALLLLLFILLSYTVTPAPPVATDEGGLEVNLGTSDNGSGNDQPMSTKKPAPYQASVMYKSVAEKSNIPKDIVRSTEADAPEVDNTKKNKKITPVADAQPKEKPKPQEKPKYTYAGDNGPGGNSAAQNAHGTSEGNTTGPGDRGVPGGTPGATNYTGVPGSGNGGIRHTLTGRTISPDKFSAEFHEGGKVVIRVTVDKAGNIISKSVVSSSSPELKAIALSKLANAKFSPSDGSEPEQHGLITINFITRQ